MLKHHIMAGLGLGVSNIALSCQPLLKSTSQGNLPSRLRVETDAWQQFNSIQGIQQSSHKISNSSDSSDANLFVQILNKSLFSLN